MANRGMTPFNVSLSAGVPQSFNVEGDYFHILTAPNASGVLVRFDEGKQANYFEGVGLRTYYARVELESEANQDVVVLLGFGHVFDARATANVTANATLEPANINLQQPTVTVPAGGSIKLADADSARKALRVAIASSEPDGVFMGDADVEADADTGGWIEPGMVDYLETEAEIWAYNPGAADVDVYVLALRRV